MSEFSKYVNMRNEGISAVDAYMETKKTGLNQITAIRMLREVYNLSLIEAKKISFEGDTGQPSDKSQPGLEKQFTDILDDLLD